LEEIAGGAALLADPTDVEDIAAKIKILDGDNARRNALSSAGLDRAKSFSLREFGTRLMDCYDNVLKDCG
jgi:glycosyltransferase involved in cell wall biosynthesis